MDVRGLEEDIIPDSYSLFTIIALRDIIMLSRGVYS